MSTIHLYEIKLLDGTRYRGEITYRDDKMVVLRVKRKPLGQKLQLFYNGIISIRELGWHKARALS
ncbi:MAG: hypothetical protein AYK18_08110 [Theionarchaea archaeon DG-70]|nr:MAG: hypothetical protein AYK18_08110 [Theionarchaea archaeon DG-70]